MNKRYHRRSIRLPGYDYSEVGWYFVTICTQNREPFFGKIINEVMILNEFGQIAFNQWRKIPDRFKNVELGQFVVMPNHIHGIIEIHDTTSVGGVFIPVQDDVTVGAGLVPALEDEINNAGAGQSRMENGQPQGLPLQVTLGDIVGAYKSLVANECLKNVKLKNETMEQLWQRNFYEHIINSDEEYEMIAAYIESNPMNWERNDKYHQP